MLGVPGVAFGDAEDDGLVPGDDGDADGVGVGLSAVDNVNASEQFPAGGGVASWAFGLDVGAVGATGTLLSW